MADQPALVLIVYLPCKADTSGQLLSGLLNVVEQMAKEPDFVSTWIHTLVDDERCATSGRLSS